MRLIYLRPQVTRFVILFVERSGSTYLATSLASHPEIDARREEFAHLRQRGADGAAQLEWARSFWTPPLLGREKARGFKSKLEDILDPDGFGRLLRERGARVIQLQRRNLIKAVVSTINARRLYEASGNWNLLRESDRLPAFEADPAEFSHLLEERIRWDRELEHYVESLGLPRLCLFYEDLLRKETDFIARVFDFIGARRREVRGKTFKSTKDDLREVLLNFDELRDQYAGTPYHAMFSEVIA
jgi:LPS sulfotransferase NodH